MIHNSHAEKIENQTAIQLLFSRKKYQESKNIYTIMTIFLGCLHNLVVEQVAGDSGYVCYSRGGHWSGPYAGFMLTLVVNLET